MRNSAAEITHKLFDGLLTILAIPARECGPCVAVKRIPSRNEIEVTVTKRRLANDGAMLVFSAAIV
ncbi:hypothetical protein RRF57_011669 [Xylaria bambusicola]|uniref:Uncharacterized protein n=1 Tax=Xylaria bambusicola TaxID=326684 RepID=A0AAN7ZA74_9PEZI